MGSFGVRRLSRKRKAAAATPKTSGKPQKAPKAIEEPIEPVVAAVEQPQAEEKKTVKKTAAKKVTEGTAEKPKTAKPRKKAAPEGEAAPEP